MLRLAIMLWLALSPPLLAGAWPRGKGNVFAVGYSYVLPSGAYSGIYGEWGMTDRLTLGVDVGRGVSGQDKSVAFVRAPLWSPGRGHRFAVELGAGRIVLNTTEDEGFFKKEAGFTPYALTDGSAIVTAFIRPLKEERP